MAIKNRVVTDNFIMEYCKFGTGEKDFVIIPGMSFKSIVNMASSVEAQFKKFCNDYTVYLFDRKLNINAGYTVYDMADDTAQAMAILGIKNANIFGASQGGMIAQCIAIKYPNLASKLVLASTVSKPNPVLENSIKNWLYLAQNNKKDELVEYFVDNVFSPSTLKKFKQYLIEQHNNLSADDINRFCLLTKANIGFNTYDSIDKIECPVFAVGGKLDKVLSVNGTQEIADKLNCQVFIYDNYGHAVYDEAPDFHNKMLEFFNK